MFDVDPIRELRLRKWAREHFVSKKLRKSTWHPVVLDEMNRRDQESLIEVVSRDRDDSILPIALCDSWCIPIPAGEETPNLATESLIYESFLRESRIVPDVADGERIVHHEPRQIRGPHWMQVTDDNDSVCRQIESRPGD